MNTNKLLLKKQNGELSTINNIDGLKIDFFGKNSQVIIGEGSIFRGSWIKLEDNSSIHIEKTAPRGINNTGINMLGSPQSELFIDEGFSVESCYFGMSNESHLSIKIGKNCMFSSSLLFTATDGHIIYDKETKQLLNRSQPIKIGEHVWIGHSATILKGSVISDHSIVAAGAIVTKVFTEKNIIVAGNPAKIVKHNVCWDKRYIDQYDIKNYINKQSSEKHVTTYNLVQKLGYTFFGFLFCSFYSKKQLLKLKNTPYDFFNDSKHTFTRSIGKLLRII